MSLKSKKKNEKLITSALVPVQGSLSESTMHSWLRLCTHRRGDIDAASSAPHIRRCVVKMTDASFPSPVRCQPNSVSYSLTISRGHCPNIKARCHLLFCGLWSAEDCVLLFHFSFFFMFASFFPFVA